MLLFLIPLIIFFNMIYLYFFNSQKKIIIQQESIKEEIKIDTQTTKDKKRNLVEKVQEKISEKVENKKYQRGKKETPKVESKEKINIFEDVFIQFYCGKDTKEKKQ